MPAKKHMRGPVKLNKYYTKCMKRYSNKEYCSRVSWEVYCQHVNPKHKGCSKYTKEIGRPYSSQKAKKSSYLKASRVLKMAGYLKLSLALRKLAFTPSEVQHEVKHFRELYEEDLSTLGKILEFRDADRKKEHQETMVEALENMKTSVEKLLAMSKAGDLMF